MPPRRRWSADTKARAAADLASGMTIKAVGEKYDMPRSTVGDLAPTSKAGATKIRKITDLRDLEAVFRHQLSLNFAALEAITRQVIDAEWLRQQSAGDLIGLYATLFAKSGKLLGALYGPAAAELEQPDPDDAEDAA
jgi:hypothetical protein